MTSSNNAQFIEAIDLWGRLTRASNFALDNWWLWPLLVITLWIALTLRSNHAMIARLDERADAAFADVDALLVERNTLLGNLAEVVRAFAQREHDVIRDVLDARVDALEAIGENAMRNDVQVANVLQNLFTVSEKYPELASGGHYSKLRDDLVRIKDRITAARRFYNLAVEELNGLRRAFPGSLFARRDDHQPREKFSLGDRRSEFSEPVKITL